MSKQIIVGNWKMNLNKDSSKKLIRDIQLELNIEDYKMCDVVICPSFVHLNIVNNEIKKKIYLGCQNVFWEKEGAYTGEVSVQIVKNIGCKYAIIGHSERRKFIGESNKVINKKVKTCVNNSVKPILCVGENGLQRKNKKTNKILRNQISSAIKGLNSKDIKKIIIAYEPIWAIGTKNPARPTDANEAAKYIKEFIKKIYKNIKAESIKVLYGGSVDQTNIRSYTKMDFIDGSLVGGASIKSSSFIQIVKNSYK